MGLNLAFKSLTPLITFSIHGQKYKDFDPKVIVLNNQVTYNPFDAILPPSSPSINGRVSKKIPLRPFGVQPSSPPSLA
jgi:hypothetical protein